MHVVITIPAYNEEKHLGPVLQELRATLKDSKHKITYLVVDDGSTDQTSKVAKDNGARVIRHSVNRGLSDTFKTEMKECLRLKADIIVHTDADGQYPASAIPALIERIESGYDLALGSRFNRGYYAGSLAKNLGNRAFALVFTHLLGRKITDTTTGFRAFTPQVAQLPLINNFTYTQEQLIRAAKNKLRITEIPIRCRKTRPSKLFSNPLQYAVRAWINILRIYRDFAPLKFFGFFGGILFTAGFLLGIFILIHTLLTGTAGAIPRVILSGVLLLGGIQVILFGFLADMIRTN